MREITYRLALFPDASYGIEITMPDGRCRLVKRFARKADAEAWLAEEQRKGPKDEVWVRQPMTLWYN